MANARRPAYRPGAAGPDAPGRGIFLVPSDFRRAGPCLAFRRLDHGRLRPLRVMSKGGMVAMAATRCVILTYRSAGHKRIFRSRRCDTPVSWRAVDKRHYTC